MTDKSGTHYHKYATRSEHNTSPPPVSSCRSPTAATVQRHDQAIIPNARLDTTTSWESIHHPANRNLKPPDTNPHPGTTEALTRTPPRKSPAIHRPAHRKKHAEAPQTFQSSSSPATLRSSHSPSPKAGISVPKQQDQAPSQPRCSLKPGGQPPLQGLPRRRAGNRPSAPVIVTRPAPGLLQQPIQSPTPAHLVNHIPPTSTSPVVVITSSHQCQPFQRKRPTQTIEHALQRVERLGSAIRRIRAPEPLRVPTDLHSHPGGPPLSSSGLPRHTHDTDPSAHSPPPSDPGRYRVTYHNQLNPAAITRRITELQNALIRLAKDKTDQRPPHPDPQHPARRPQGRTSQASLLTTPGLRGHTYVRHRQHFAGTLTRGTPGAAGDDRSGPAPARAGRRRHSPGTGSCGMPRPGRRAPSRRSSRVLRSVPPA